MFMFVFSMLMIAATGLFFQLVNSLAMAFALQQVGMGQQVMRWHTMAYEYVCATAMPVGDVDGAAVLTQDSNQQNGEPIYPGPAWPSILYDTTHSTGSNLHILLTYIDPTASYKGVSGIEVGRQLRKASTRSMLLGQVTAGHTIRLTVSDTVSGYQSTDIDVPPTVPVGASALLTIANCN
jgi:hypothetical protein